jgi:hypothetical protein
MREPANSNIAQRKSDAVTPPPVKLDPLGNRTVPDGDATAIHGGEETKPGQMDGDEDASPSDRQDAIEATIHRTIPPGG